MGLFLKTLPFKAVLTDNSLLHKDQSGRGYLKVQLIKCHFSPSFGSCFHVERLTPAGEKYTPNSMKVA